MKKIKIMLTAITVMAVVGGALAFKAQKFGARVYCTDTPGAVCNIRLDNSTVVDPGGNPITISSTCTNAANSGSSCAKTTVYKLD